MAFLDSLKQSIANWAQKNPNKAQKLLKFEKPVTTATNAYNKAVVQPTVPLVKNAAYSVARIMNPALIDTVRTEISLYDKNKNKIAPILKKPAATISDILKKSKFTTRVNMEDIGNIAGGVGALNVPENIIGGGLGVGINSVQNIINKKPVLADSGKAYREGYEFSAKLGPLGKLAKGPLTPILNKISPAGLKGASGIAKRTLSRAIEGGASMGLYGTMLPAKDTKEALVNGLKNAGQGALFSGATGLVNEAFSKVFNKGVPEVITPKQLEQVKAYLRDTAGRFATEAKTGVKGKYPSDVFGSNKQMYGDIDTILGGISERNPIGFQTKAVKEGSLLSNVSRAVKQGKITPQEAELYLNEGKTMSFAKTVTEKPGKIVPETKVKVEKGIKQGDYQYDEMKFQEALKTSQGKLKNKKAFSQTVADLGSDKIPENPGQHIADATVVYEKLVKSGRLPEANAILDKTIEKLTKMGQGISLSKLFLQSTPQGKYRMIVRSLEKVIEKTPSLDKFLKTKRGTLEITDEFKRNLLTQLETAQTLKGEAKITAEGKILQTVADFIPTGADDFVTQLRYNGMLSNPRTQTRNLYSNMIQAGFVRPATMALSGDIKGAAKYYVGAIKALPEAWDVMKTTYKTYGEAAPNGEISTTTMTDILHGKTGKANKNVYDKLTSALTLGKWATKFLESTDQFFQTVISKGEMANGKSADEASKIAQKYLFRSNFNPDLKSGQGVVLSGIDKLADWVQKGPKVIRWFIPFIKTPTQVLKQSIEYSPLGVTTLIGHANKKEQLAKAALGTAFTAFSGIMAMNDRTTWEVPTDQKQKELFFAAGKKPYSVLIGNQWVPMQYFGVFAPAMAMAAAAKHYSQDSNKALTDTQIQKIGKGIAGMAKYIFDQSFLSGLGQFVDLMTGDTDVNLSSISAFTGGQIIPQNALLGYIAKIIDPVYRKADDDFIQQFAKNIPFASKSLPAYTTPAGEESKRSMAQLLLPAPYEIGTQNDMYGQMEQERIDKLQQNNILNMLKKANEKGDSASMERIMGAQPTVAPIQAPTKSPTTIEQIINKKVQDEEKSSAINQVLKLTNIPYEQRVSMLQKQGYTPQDIKDQEMKVLKSSDTSVKVDYIRQQVSQGQTDFTTLYKNGVLTTSTAKELERQGYVPDADQLIKNMKMTDVYEQNKEIRRLQKSSLKKLMTLQKRTMKSILNRKTKTYKYKAPKVPKPKKIKIKSYKFPKIKIG